MNRLDFMRRSRKMTQKEMSRLTGIYPTTCSRLYNGWFAKIHPDHLAALQRVFGNYTFAQFMEEVEVKE